jgi:hypothetical protein
MYFGQVTHTSSDASWFIEDESLKIIAHGKTFELKLYFVHFLNEIVLFLYIV